MAENITIYTIKQSDHCSVALGWLEKHNIKYHEICLDEDDDAKEELVELAGQLSVPTLVVHKNGGDKMIIGFEPAEYQANLL